MVPFLGLWVQLLWAWCISPISFSGCLSCAADRSSHGGCFAIVTIVAVPLELANPDSRPWDIWSTLLIIEITVSFAALVFLFAPGARRWFDGTPDNLAETFS